MISFGLSELLYLHYVKIKQWVIQEKMSICCFHVQCTWFTYRLAASSYFSLYLSTRRHVIAHNFYFKDSRFKDIYIILQNLYNLPQEIISAQPVYLQYIAAFAQHHQPGQLDNKWLLGTCTTVHAWSSYLYHISKL